MAKITVADSIAALENDYRELLMTFNDDVVEITRIQPDVGYMCKLKITVHAPCYFLNGANDVSPKLQNWIEFYVAVKNFYPQTKPIVYYAENRYLASVNVWNNGVQCIDHWNVYSSLCSIVEKTVKDIIHDPMVTRYDSMANVNMENWQKQMTAQKKLPTMASNMIYSQNN